MRRLIAAVLPAIVVAGCVNPSAEIATELTRYGLASGQAQCVGGRIERNLSIGQLRQLSRAGRALTENDTTPGRLTPTDLLRVAGRINGPRITITVAKAAAGCGVLTGGRAF